MLSLVGLCALSHSGRHGVDVLLQASECLINPLQRFQVIVQHKLNLRLLHNDDNSWLQIGSDMADHVPSCRIAGALCLV